MRGVCKCSICGRFLACAPIPQCEKTGMPEGAVYLNCKKCDEQSTYSFYAVTHKAVNCPNCGRFLDKDCNCTHCGVLTGADWDDYVVY